MGVDGEAEKDIQTVKRKIHIETGISNTRPR